MKLKKKILILTEAVILGAMLCSVILSGRYLKIYEPDLGEWRSEYGENTGQAWEFSAEDMNDFFADADEKGEESICLLYGPFINLPKGQYTIEISYKADEDLLLVPYAANGYDQLIEAGEITLSRHRNYQTYSVAIKENIPNMEVSVRSETPVDAEISEIRIQENNRDAWKMFVLMLAAVSVVNIVVFKKQWLQNHKKDVFLTFVLWFMASMPLFVQGIDHRDGQDLVFHLLRIEGIAEELLNGNFPVRMQGVWMEGYGYPASIFYGDALLYIPAILRIFGFSVLESYKIYVGLINLGTILLAFYGFSGIFKKKGTAWICTFAYTLATYRLVNLYIRQAVGEYSAVMFLPLIAVAVVGIYETDPKQWKGYRKNALYLALGMTGLINTHILTTEMTVLVLGAVAIFFFRRTFRKRTLQVYVYAVGLTLLLNAFYIVPFVDYYLHVPVQVTNGMGTMKLIQGDGLFLSQLFAFFQEPFGYTASTGDNLLSLTPGLLLMSAFVFSLWLIVKRKASKKIMMYAFFSAVALFVTTDFFPWNWLVCHVPGGNLIAQVQFPWRYLVMADLFLTLLLGSLHEVLEKDKKEWRLSMIRTVFLMQTVTCIIFAGAYLDGVEIHEFYDTADLDSHYIGRGEYLRTETEMDQWTYQIQGVNVNALELQRKNGSDMDIYCEASPGDATVILPVLNYKGYTVTDENGNVYMIQDGPQNEICVTVPGEFEGMLYVRFSEMAGWRIADLISLLTVLCLVLIPMAGKIRKQRSASLC